MRLLRVNEDYEVIPERDSLSVIPEFAPLFTLAYNKQEGDKDGRRRNRVRDELVFVYFMHDYRSEYSDLAEGERREQALVASALPPDFKESPELQRAVAKFLELQDTREIRLLKSAYNAVDMLREYLDTVKVTDKNAKNVMDNLSKLGAVINSLKQVETQVKKAMGGANRTRGDQQRGRLM